AEERPVIATEDGWPGLSLRSPGAPRNTGASKTQPRPPSILGSEPMDSLLDRFCRYVRIDTQADESATTYPSSTGQLHLGRMLVDELQAFGVRDATQDAHGLVWATIPATVKHAAPVMAWIAHVDTSPETSGHN